MAARVASTAARSMAVSLMGASLAGLAPATNAGGTRRIPRGRIRLRTDDFALGNSSPLTRTLRPLRADRERTDDGDTDQDHPLPVVRHGGRRGGHLLHEHLQELARPGSGPLRLSRSAARGDGDDRE